MAVKVAYGSRSKIKTAIQQGVIPPDCVIITTDGELLFYNADEVLADIVNRTVFDSEESAEAYVIECEMRGKTVTALINGAYKAFIVQDDYTLTPIGVEELDSDILQAIDERLTLLEDESHFHDNKAVLDGIDADKIAQWDAASGGAVNVNLLVQTEGDELILVGGSSNN